MAQKIIPLIAIAGGMGYVIGSLLFNKGSTEQEKNTSIKPGRASEIIIDDSPAVKAIYNDIYTQSGLYRRPSNGQQGQEGQQGQANHSKGPATGAEDSLDSKAINESDQEEYLKYIMSSN